MYLTKKTKEDLFKKHGKDAKDTGSAEGQIALFTCLLYTSDAADD